MSDPRKYRTKEEEQRFEADDPIDKLAKVMIDEGEMSQEVYDDLVQEVRQEVRDAMKWADESPVPPIEELYTDVYTHEWGPYRGTSLPQMLQERPSGEGEASERLSDR